MTSSDEHIYICVCILCIIIISNHLLVQYRIIRESMTVYQDIEILSMSP